MIYVNKEEKELVIDNMFLINLADVTGRVIEFVDIDFSTDIRKMAVTHNYVLNHHIPVNPTRFQRFLMWLHIIPKALLYLKQVDAQPTDDSFKDVREKGVKVPDYET